MGRSEHGQRAFTRSIQRVTFILIQITTVTGQLVKTITIEEIPRQDVIVYSPCGYCGVELVKAPRKFCCNAHRVAYCEKRIGQRN